MTAKLKTAVRLALDRIGFQVIHSPAGSSEHEIARPMATYAPWNASSEFLAVYKSIHSNTLVDIYRCWELWTLVEQVSKLDGAILEIGVWRGGSGALMAKKAVLCGIADPVYLCDTFEGVVKAGPHDTVYKGGEHSDTSQDIVEALLRTLNLSNARVLKGTFPDQTAHLIEPDVRFRLCHVDVDVYDSAKNVMDWAWTRMVPAGVVVYDDYGFRGGEGITKYVNEQIPQGDRLVLHNLNGHGIVVKLPMARQSALAT